jgi:hypothetical protein
VNDPILLYADRHPVVAGVAIVCIAICFLGYFYLWMRD